MYIYKRICSVYYQEKNTVLQQVYNSFFQSCLAYWHNVLYVLCFIMSVVKPLYIEIIYRQMFEMVYCRWYICLSFQLILKKRKRKRTHIVKQNKNFLNLIRWVFFSFFVWDIIQHQHIYIYLCIPKIYFYDFNTYIMQVLCNVRYIHTFLGCSITGFLGGYKHKYI